MTQNICTLITGASSGIGRETAIKLSDSQRILLHGRDLDRLEETRQHCKNPLDHYIWAADLGDVKQIDTSLSSALSRNNIKISNFVHCAGTLHIGPLRLQEHDATIDLFNINFFSAVEISKLLIRKKINSNILHGIIFVSSTASKFGARGFSTYCASKGALDAYMRALAVELAPDVRVNSILPGAVRTSMTESIFEDVDIINRMEDGYPLGLGKQSDIASAVEFLLSSSARWITGQQLVVDGGRTVNISG